MPFLHVPSYISKDHCFLSPATSALRPLNCDNDDTFVLGIDANNNVHMATTEAAISKALLLLLYRSALFAVLK